MFNHFSVLCFSQVNFFQSIVALYGYYSFVRLQEIEAEFDKHVSLKDIASQQLDVDPDGIVYIYNYWKLKRRVSEA